MPPIHDKEAAGPEEEPFRAASDQAEGKKVERTIHVEIDDETHKPARSYSVDEFGKILQLSQWSLTHRIEVCKVLQVPGNSGFMSPLSRHAYAKQAMALIKDHRSKTFIRDISTSDLLPIKVDPAVLQERVEMLVYDDWKWLAKALEVELERLRGEDKKKKWYTTLFKRKAFFQPWDLYSAIEQGQEKDFKKKLEMIGWENWTFVRPQEYRGATPWHWAVLHNLHVPRGQEFRFAFDDFGFELIHMAIFASSWIPFLSKQRYREERERDSSKFLHPRSGPISNCANLFLRLFVRHLYLTDNVEPGNDDGEPVWDGDGEPIWDGDGEPIWDDGGDPMNYGSEPEGDADKTNDDHQGRDMDGSSFSFLIFKLASFPESRSYFTGEKYFNSPPRSCFVAKQFFNPPIHFLHLAVWIGHPQIIEKLMKRVLKETSIETLMITRVKDLFNTRTEHGDTILHIAAWALDPSSEFDYDARQKIMAILIWNLHQYPFLLNSSNAAGQRPLHIAAFQGSRECVEALLRCPYINVDVRNKKDFTPLTMVLNLVLKLQNENKEREYAKILGGKCSINEEYGLPTFNYDDAQIDSQKPCSVRRDHEGIIDFLTKLDPEICRQRQILQSSQWSLRHRVLALQMFSENATTLENIKGTYTTQCSKLVGLVDESMEEMDRLEHLADKLRERLSVTEHPNWLPSSSKDVGTLRKIYRAIEEGDCFEFERLMDKLTVNSWSKSLEEYQGATPLHWAVLYDREDMVSLMDMYRKGSNNSVEPESWSAIVNAGDKFGFTLLHSAVFSSSFYLSYRSQGNDKMLWKVKDSVRLIDKVYEMGVRHSASNNSHSEFLVWNLTDCIHVDNYLSSINLSPMYLGMHLAHPRIVEKLLESFPAHVISKNMVSVGDTESILHCAEPWEALNKRCLEDEWRKIQSIVLMHLGNLPKAVNTRNQYRETPLHIAVRTKSVKWTEVLLQCEHVNFNLRNRDKQTPGDLAVRMLQSSSAEDKALLQEIINLIDCFDPESWPRQKKEKERMLEAEQKKEREQREEKERTLEVERKKEREERAEKEKALEAERKKEREDRIEKEKQLEKKRQDTQALQRDRQVYVDAANAILVGATLIASASFGAWLQPPLGFQPYYSPEFHVVDAPPAVGPQYESFVAVRQYWTIRLFWFFNSLSFFFSLATVIAGADAALPQQGLPPKEAVASVKNAVKIAASLLILAIGSVIGTFTTIGFTVLPPIAKYRSDMVVSLSIGGFVCVCFLIKLVVKLVSKAQREALTASTGL